MKHIAYIRDRRDEGIYAGNLARGCTQCVRGAKMVLFVTGVCDMGCFYCPVSFHRANKDVVYANERQVFSDEDIIDEAERMGALGTGITGGDPLIVPQRTAHYISLLKEHFGSGHHIHLYTGRPNIEALPLLSDAGLDELRIHPPEAIWSRFHGTVFEKMIQKARTLNMRVGIEVPVLPGMLEELSALITSAAQAGAQFANLNELEMSESNAEELRKRGYVTVDDGTNAVEGSREVAEKIVRRSFSIPVHYCPSRFKDAVQLRERLKRTAKRIRWAGEIATDDGTLLKGVVEECDPELVIEHVRRLGVPSTYYRIEGKRVEIAPWILEEIASELPGSCYIVEEYPTAAPVEVERRPLTRR
jgi:pyruvate formate-lyase activating enzyme-like uncharacterized protein